MPKPKDRDITLSTVHGKLMDERNRPQREREMAQMMRTVLPMMLGLGAGKAAPTLGGKATTKRKRKG
jgi:hypothetical protein